MTEPDRGAARPGTAGEAVIVVGVEPRQDRAVVARAAELAAMTGARLLCAYADPASYVVEEEADGSVEVMPIDPDGMDDRLAAIETGLRDQLAERLDATGVRWEFRELAGDPARALDHLAAHVDAMMIVVGTKHDSVGARLEEILTGSIAVHLTRRQRRPVLVVPVHPQ